MSRKSWNIPTFSRALYSEASFITKISSGQLSVYCLLISSDKLNEPIIENHGVKWYARFYVHPDRGRHLLCHEISRG